MAYTQVRDTLDTNLIVHYILGDVPKQRKAVAKLLSKDGMVHFVPDLALTETVYVFEQHYNQNRAIIVANLQKFLTSFEDILEYNRELFELVFPFYEKHPSLSFNDCYMAFAAELNHAEPLFTFDAKLVRQHPSAKKLV